MEPATIIHDTIRILPNLRDLLAWAHNDGYQPTAPNPDRPTRVPPPPKPGQPKGGPDDQPGPKHDIGIGNHTSRMAYGHAVLALAAADSQLVAATALVTGKAPQNRGVEWDGGVQLPEALRLSVRVAARLRRFEGAARARGVPENVEARVLRACTSVNQAHDLLAKALNKGPADLASVALEKDRCRRCGHRGEGVTSLNCKQCKRQKDAARKREARRKQGKKARRRRDGSEAQMGDYMQGETNKAKRKARGEDHGDESFGCVVVHEGEWPVEHPGPLSGQNPKGAA